MVEQLTLIKEIMGVLIAIAFAYATLVYTAKEFKSFKLSIIKTIDKLAENFLQYRLDQVKHQSITDTKIDQIQNDIKNIRDLDTLNNSLIEKIEKSEFENSLNIKNLDSRVHMLEKKTG